MLRSKKIHNPPPKYIKTRSWKNLEDRAVQEDCAQFPFASLFTALSVDHAWEVFKSFALCVIDHHAPVKEFRVRGSKIPWLTDDIRQEMFKRDHLRKKASSTKDQETNSRFRTQRNYTHKCILNAKREYYDSLIQESVNDSKTLWSSLKSMLPKKATTVTQSVLLPMALKLRSHWRLRMPSIASSHQSVPL